MADRPEIRIDLRSQHPMKRVDEPITCGVPFPKGILRDGAALRMFDAAGQPIPLQTRVLDKWSDGSARWVLCDWRATDSVYRLRTDSGDRAESASSFTIDPEHRSVTSGKFQYEFRLPSEALLCVSAKGEPASEQRFFHLQAVDADGTEYGPEITSWSVEESGPLRTSVRVAGQFHSDSQVPLLPFSVRFHWFAHSQTLRVHLTITNPNAAGHPGGLWDLGGDFAVFLRSLTVELIGKAAAVSPTRQQGREADDSPSLARRANAAVETRGNIQYWLDEKGTASSGFTLHQDSSGGPNWQSTNHQNRKHVVPNQFQGYRLKADDLEKTGLRATPIVALDRDDQHLAVSMPYFWQNFPKAIEADGHSITLGLFPRQYADVHELQGGEQKTHVFYVSFGRDTVTEEPLAWTRDPLIPVVDPEWVASTGAIPYLSPMGREPHSGYQQLVDAAIEGPDTFEKKREVIDEYGWRHFGDIYGDHEAVYHRGPTPLVSHYNNQYDAVAGSIYQYLRSGDLRWWQMLNEMAAHVIDIDLYHTDRDKAAYNHGLFWHTYHYVDADTGTHRSYPKNGRIPPHNQRVPGGGPANEQNYATGLMLHYFLTGDAASKEAAVGLAQWVIDMDDGTKTPFRWLSRGHTGLASQSRTPDYHGPGRGSANSISVLLDGHRLTGDRKYLAKAEQIVHRCIHPTDDVPGRNLLDAENRWFYTMFLQALGKYLDHKAALGELDAHYAYARASLLHYARWMAEHEYPYLEKPELLEYPTETWAAQDMRKCEIFQFAGLHADGGERERFRERAAFFYRYSVDKLMSLPTRTLCRPVVLMLSNGFSREWHEEHPDAKAPRPLSESTDFGWPERFVPQKILAVKRFKEIAVAGGLAAVAGLVYWCFV